MKLAITTENKLGITDDVLSLLRGHEADLIKVEVEDGKIYLHTHALDQSTQRVIASQLMKIAGVKWVNQIDVLPGVETQHMLASLMQAMPDPVLGINTKGQIVYLNQAAQAGFAASGEQLKHMKEVFVSNGWQEKVNAAANSNLPVNIETTAGKMLLEVRGVKDAKENMNGALLLFRKHDKIHASAYVMQGEAIDGLGTLVYQSGEFEQVVNKAKTLAVVDAPLNIVGETGTGKTLLAHVCHSLSPRQNELFTVIDCQAMKDEALGRLLFGEKQQPGMLELNQKGTLYFSHIEFMSPHIQTKLLDALKQSAGARLMASSGQKIAACDQLNPKLVLMLDVLQLEVPPLRDRVEDIEPLVSFFLQEFNDQLGQNLALSLDAITKMKRYYWPGNATQIKHALYKAMMVVKDDVIQASDLDLAGSMSMEADLEGMGLNQAVNEFEKHFLQHWYQKYPSTRKLARQLGVSHTTIAQKIKKYQLN